MSSFIPRLAILAAVFGLAACEDAIVDANTTSQFVSPSSSGFINSPYRGVLKTEELDRFDSRGYAYGVESVDGEGFFAVAGLLPGTVVTAVVPTSGSNIYEGTYNLDLITNISLDGNVLQGIVSSQSGILSLSAEFGTGGGTVQNFFPNPDLRVNGTFNSSGDLSGTVEFAGLEGQLTGVIDSDAVIGAFHADSNDQMYAGGFALEED